MNIYISIGVACLLLAGCFTPPPVTVQIVAGVVDGDMCFIWPKTCEVDGFGMSRDEVLPVHGLVLVENRSPYPFVIGATEFSTGYKALEFEVVEGESVRSVRKNDPIWYRNLPEYDVLLPGAKRILPISLDSRIWDQGPSSFALSKGVRMRPILRYCFFIVDGQPDWPYATTNGLIYGSWFDGAGVIKRVVHGKWGDVTESGIQLDDDVCVDVGI